MINELQTRLNHKQDQVISWIRDKKSIDMPIYSSYDIRDNGVKAAIVDSNLFPGGFNNLTSEARGKAAEVFKRIIPKYTSSKDILIIPEAHTRNQYYLSNLFSLRGILLEAGYRVTLGTARDDITTDLEVEDSSGHRINLERMQNADGRLITRSFRDGLILLNNDFSVEAPALLQNVTNPILPPLQLGWFHRKKHNHFRKYCALTRELSGIIGIDQWLLCPETREVNGISFAENKNIASVAEEVDIMIELIRKKYRQHKIDEEPYVLVKDNSGTYGMGILTVQSGKEVTGLNSRGRQKMRFGKQKSPISSVIIQEGISTKYRIKNGAAEPVIYSVGGQVIGGFMRVHEERGHRSNLNAPGAKFDTGLKPDITCPISDCTRQDRVIRLYELLADIAAVAIGMEMHEL
ncbi:MAG: glutamate--cysteine ligase [archaeon]